ncbi:MAG TPA: hypothetical protein VGM07_07065 [Stellaceae bacterium]|jgi:deoxycytidine triphosphate deaminase
MSLIALTTDPGSDSLSVVTSSSEFRKDGTAVLIQHGDTEQLKIDSEECNDGYDLRVGAAYRDHRNDDAQVLSQNDTIILLPGNAVIIQTQEWVEFPELRFGQIFPKVGLLQRGVTNTPSKVDPGFHGHLLVTVHNYGRRKVCLRRGQRFCSLHVFSVKGPIRPYKKDPPDIGTPRPAGRVQKIGDNIDAYNARLTVIALVVSAIALVVGAVAAVLPLLLRR